MKFTISSKQLFSKLQAAAQVINKRNTLPILDCFLFCLRGNILNIEAADEDIRLDTTVEVENAQGSGKIALHAKTIVDALKELPDQPITFDLSEHNSLLTISYHNGKFSLMAQDAEYYPTPKPFNENNRHELEIDSNVLFEGLAGTLIAVANDVLRPIMSGVCFDISPDDVTFVASDGHKLVKLVNKRAKGSARSSFVLPTKGANILKALLAKQSDPVCLNFDTSQATFGLTDYKVTVRFTEGRYPNYNSVIPQNNFNKFSIDKSALSAIIKRVSVFSNQASNMIKLQLSDNTLIVSAQDLDFSTAAEEKENIEYNGKPMSIGFKYSFLLDLITNIQASDIEIQLSEPSKAALIVPIPNNSEWDNISLIMPIILTD